jgi:hypothetical protein
MDAADLKPSLGRQPEHAFGVRRREPMALGRRQDIPVRAALGPSMGLAYL